MKLKAIEKYIPNLQISTWQSIYKQPKEWFAQFDVVYGDECLHPDTEITMGDGSNKKIKDVVVGDLVKTLNENTHEIECKPVLKVHENISINEDMFEVETAGGHKLKITGNHKVLLNTGEWKAVKDVKVGDIINMC